jgi:hypothetical protein
MPLLPPVSPAHVDHHLAHALGHAERGDGEVVALQAQDRDPHQHREADAHRGRGRQRDPEAGACLGHQHRGRVAAEPEEHDVAEARIAGEAADQVPALRQRHEHEHAAERALLGLEQQVGGRQRQHHEPERDQRHPDPGAALEQCGQTRGERRGPARPGGDAQASALAS